MQTIAYSTFKKQLEAEANYDFKIWTFYTANPALFSRFIRFSTRAKISHVGFIVWYGGRLWVVEMMEGEDCVPVPASNRFEKEPVVYVGAFKTSRFHDEFVDSILADVRRVKYSKWGAIIAKFIKRKSSERICSGWVTTKIPLDFSSLNRGVLPSDVFEKCDETYLLSF